MATAWQVAISYSVESSYISTRQAEPHSSSVRFPAPALLTNSLQLRRQANSARSICYKHPRPRAQL